MLKIMNNIYENPAIFFVYFRVILFIALAFSLFVSIIILAFKLLSKVVRCKFFSIKLNQKFLFFSFISFIFIIFFLVENFFNYDEVEKFLGIISGRSKS